MRLIDADAFFEEFAEIRDYEYASQEYEVDAVEVVRCRDCIYGEQDEVGRWYCRSFGCEVGDSDGSGYCADGERKE